LTSGTVILNPEAFETVKPAKAATSSRYLRHVHLLRGIAIILVVGAHCWPGFSWSPAQTTGMLLVFDNVTVLFMFISGLLFQHLSATFVYPRYLRHRLSIVVLPYLIISIPAVLMAVFVAPRTDVWPWVYQMPAWEQILFFFATGRHLAPLWFIPMMTLFIFCAPLFIWIDRRNLYPVLIPITLAFAVILGRDSAPGLWNVFSKALFMLPAYLSGMAFARHREACEKWCGENRVALALGVIIVSLAIVSGYFRPSDLTILQKLLLAVLLLAMVKAIQMPKLMERSLIRIADMSFAIYFVHGYVITISRICYTKLGGGTVADAQTPGIFEPSLAGLALDIILVMVVSVGLISIAQRMLGRHSRMIIGA
jgi:peptidoglycan/LPS O-acetylase OafA/YrhL